MVAKNLAVLAVLATAVSARQLRNDDDNEPMPAGTTPFVAPAEDLTVTSGLFEGDILVSEGMLKKAYSEEVARKAVEAGQATKGEEGGEDSRGPTAIDVQLWQNRDSQGRIIIPLTLSPRATFTQNEVDAIVRGFQTLSANTGVFVIKGRTNERDYVELTSESGCYAQIGRQGGKQPLNLQRNGCLSSGTIQHEMMHTLGFWHEQSRPDRDQFVTIVENNLIQDQQTFFQFEKRSTAEIDSLGSPYDYGSVMHYPATAFSRNGGITIDAKGNSIGQRVGPSATDILQIQLLYQCPSGPRDFADFCSPDCPCDQGQGDCDTDADCRGSLRCIQQDGFDFCGGGASFAFDSRAPNSNLIVPSAPEGSVDPAPEDLVKDAGSNEAPVNQPVASSGMSGATVALGAAGGAGVVILAALGAAVVARRRTSAAASEKAASITSPEDI